MPKVSPPIIVIAKGFWLCAPIPFESAAGISPSIATSEADRTGRNLLHARLFNSSSPKVFVFISEDRIITLFCIDTPIAAIRPTPVRLKNMS